MTHNHLRTCGLPAYLQRFPPGDQRDPTVGFFNPFHSNCLTGILNNYIAPTAALFVPSAPSTQWASRQQGSQITGIIFTIGLSC